MKGLKALTAVCAVSLIFAGDFAVTKSYGAGQPGTNADPLVSKSYVDDRIDQLLKGGVTGGTASGVSSADKDEIVSDVMAQIEFLYGDKLKEAPTGTYEAPTDTYGASSASYAPVSLSAGQILIGGEGAEIILRSGKASVYSTVSDGLGDVTDGSDLKNGAPVSKNHLLIVSRDDGRGVKAGDDVWLLVKGSYEILN